MIFDILEYIIIEWTMPNESRVCRTVLILEKRRRVLLASLQPSVGQKRRLDTKTKQGRLRGRVDKYCFRMAVHLQEAAGLGWGRVLLAVVKE